MKQAFSLVELSIVLVILGLIVGGITVGQSLMRGAELRGVSAEIEQQRTALNIFKTRYEDLPGDMSNAADYWGALDGGDGEGDDCFMLETSELATCSGNGDRSLANSGVSAQWNRGERFTYWVHLVNAGLIEGDYTGRTDSTTDSYALTAGKNSPGSAIDTGVWGVNAASLNNPGGVSTFPTPIGVMLTLRSVANSSQAPLSAKEMWSIDSKIDDGLPGTGQIQSQKNVSAAAPGCASTNDENTAEYVLNYTANNCHFRAFIEY